MRDLLVNALKAFQALENGPRTTAEVDHWIHQIMFPEMNAIHDYLNEHKPNISITNCHFG